MVLLSTRETDKRLSPMRQIIRLFGNNQQSCYLLCDYHCSVVIDRNSFFFFFFINCRCYLERNTYEIGVNFKEYVDFFMLLWDQH